MKTNAIAALLRLSALARDGWEGALQEILRLDSELLDVDRVSFWCLQDDPPQIACDLGYVRSSRYFERGTVIRRATSPVYVDEVRRLQLIDASDARQDPRTRDLAAYLESKNIGAILDMPVCREGGVVGVLCHEHVGGIRQWTSQDQEFAMLIGQTLTAMLETQMRRDSEVAERRAAFLADVVPSLSVAGDAHEIAKLAVRRALPALGDWGTLVTFEGGIICHRAVAHVTAEGQRLVDAFSQRFPPEREGPHLVARAICEKQSLIVPVIGAEARAAFAFEPELAELQRSLKVRSAMAVPLVFRGQLSGGMEFFSDHRTYGPKDVRFAEAYARQIGGILECRHLYQQAQEAIRVRDEFLSLASHELRTPLTSLRAAAQVIVREVGNGGASAKSLSRMGQIIEGQIERLDHLSAQMLDASEIVGGISLRRSHFDLAEVTRDVASSLSQRAKRHGSQLIVQAESPVLGDWDRARLEQVVTNLLDNAIKFGRGEPIEVSTALHDGRATLSVHDHGIGISREALDRLFVRYHRGVSAQSFGGLGLGLYVVRRIVESHGGTINVESCLENGATFTIDLPVKADTAPLSPRDG